MFFKRKLESSKPKIVPEIEPEHPREEALRSYWREIDRLKANELVRG